MSNEQIVKKLVDTVAKEKNYENYELDIKQITTGGANYTSFLYEIKISQDNRDDLLLFAKVAAFGEEMRKSGPMEEVYHLEIYFYTTIGKAFQSLEERYSVPEKDRLILSKLYAFSMEPLEETLVMDNLSKMGYLMFDRLKALGWKEMTSMVRELTKFHALSFAYGHKYPEEYNESKKHMNISVIMQENPGMLDIWRTMLNTAKGTLDEKNVGPFERFFDNNLEECLKTFLNEAKQRVFIHGDYRPSNLMYKPDESGDMKIAILDYQTMRSGSVITDLMYLIFTSTDQKFRNQHYDELLEFYYSELAAALRRLDVDPDLIYSKQDYQEDLKQNSIMGLAASAFVLQIVLVEESEAPAVDGTMSMESFHVKSSSLFKQRFNEIVEDYIKWGLIK